MDNRTISSERIAEREHWDRVHKPPTPQRDREGRPVIDERLLEKQAQYRDFKDSQGMTTQREYDERKALSQRIDV